MASEQQHSGIISEQVQKPLPVSREITMTPTLDISLVIPLLDEAESLPELVPWIARVVEEARYTYEIILIDDGSKDDSWQVIREMSNTYTHLKGIRFQRNYGKSAALHSGFYAAKGEVVITMDADLQDSPDEIPELVQMLKEGKYDLVSGWKKKRYDPLTKTIPTKLFNGVTRWVSKVRLHDFNCGLKAYDYHVIKSIDVYGEMHRYIPAIAKWAGFYRIGEKVVQHRPRKYGKTKFGLERFVNGLLDLMSITFVSKFRKRPMHFFGTMGIVSFMLGFIFTTYVIGEKLVKLYVTNQVVVRAITDQPLFYLALVALIVGVQLFLAGFLGEMVSINSPRRNDYLIRETVRLDEDED